MRVVPVVDSDGIVLREITEHQARELLKFGLVIPVWGARRIVALLECRRDVITEDLTSGSRGTAWSPTQFADGAWSLTEIPKAYGPFFTPRWTSIFTDAQRPSAYQTLPAIATSTTRASC